MVAGIAPYDTLEAAHQKETLAWIDSNLPLHRTAKPDTPPMHLVSYFAVLDRGRQALLLVDHRKAHAWLPPGGHVELHEDPRLTVAREAQEELELHATFDAVAGDQPLFITVTKTRGPGTHTDVSLWFVLEGNASRPLAFDTGEFHAVQWLSFDDVLAMEQSRQDPHLHRFVGKLQQRLAES